MKPTCDFCYNGEQGKHGEIRSEWSWEWMLHFNACRKHSFENHPDNKPH